MKFKSNANMKGYDRKKYVCKLLYIYMLGYEIDFGHMEAVALLSSDKYSEKHIVILLLRRTKLYYFHAFLSDKLNFANQNKKTGIPCLYALFKRGTRAINPHYKLHQARSCQQEYGKLPMLGFNCNSQRRRKRFCRSPCPRCSKNSGRRVSRAVANIILITTTRIVIIIIIIIIIIPIYSRETKSLVRKKAALCLLRLYRKYPEILPPDSWSERVINLLSGRDLGVITSVMGLLLELTAASPGDYEKAVPKVVRLLYKVFALLRL